MIDDRQHRPEFGVAVAGGTKHSRRRYPENSFEATPQPQRPVVVGHDRKQPGPGSHFDPPRKVPGAPVDAAVAELHDHLVGLPRPESHDALRCRRHVIGLELAWHQPISIPLQERRRSCNQQSSLDRSNPDHSSRRPDAHWLGRRFLRLPDEHRVAAEINQPSVVQHVETVRLLGFLLQLEPNIDLQRFRIESQDLPRRKQPEPATRVVRKRQNPTPLAANRHRLKRPVTISDDAATLCAYPQRAVRRGGERGDSIGAHLRVIHQPEISKAPAVEATQAVQRSNPDEAPRIAGNRLDRMLLQAIGHPPVLSDQVVARACCGGRGRESGAQREQQAGVDQQACRPEPGRARLGTELKPVDPVPIQQSVTRADGIFEGFGHTVRRRVRLERHRFPRAALSAAACL